MNGRSRFIISKGHNWQNLLLITLDLRQFRLCYRRLFYLIDQAFGIRLRHPL